MVSDWAKQARYKAKILMKKTPKQSVTVKRMHSLDVWHTSWLHHSCFFEQCCIMNRLQNNCFILKRHNDYVQCKTLYFKMECNHDTRKDMKQSEHNTGDLLYIQYSLIRSKSINARGNIYKYILKHVSMIWFIKARF